MTFKNYLKQNMITYRAFAEKSGLDFAQVAKFASGRNLPSLKNAFRIYNHTDKKVNLKDWFNGKNTD